MCAMLIAGITIIVSRTRVTTPQSQQHKVIAYHRWSEGGPGDDVVVVLNFANRGYASHTLGLPRTGRWRVRLNSDWNGYDPSFGNSLASDTDAFGGDRDGLPATANVGIGPYTALILSQDA
jgi:1,4-alpha-glucan branching enzyme